MFLLRKIELFNKTKTFLKTWNLKWYFCLFNEDEQRLRSKVPEDAGQKL